LLESVPGTTHYLAGLMNFSGESIPVIDLALRLKLNHSDIYTVDTPILLCSDGIHQMGMIVDKVIGLYDINEGDLRYHDEFNNENSPFFASVSLNVKLSLLLNINQLFETRFTIDTVKNDLHVKLES
jgi:purine-binding chemotaxis protein CheW